MVNWTFFPQVNMWKQQWTSYSSQPLHIRTESRFTPNQILVLDFWKSNTSASVFPSVQCFRPSVILVYINCWRHKTEMEKKRNCDLLVFQRLDLFHTCEESAASNFKVKTWPVWDVVYSAPCLTLLNSSCLWEAVMVSQLCSRFATIKVFWMLEHLTHTRPFMPITSSQGNSWSRSDRISLWGANSLTEGMTDVVLVYFRHSAGGRI